MIPRWVAAVACFPGEGEIDSSKKVLSSRWPGPGEVDSGAPPVREDLLGQCVALLWFPATDDLDFRQGDDGGPLLLLHLAGKFFVHLGWAFGDLGLRGRHLVGRHLLEPLSNGVVMRITRGEIRDLIGACVYSLNINV
jgi:hypothetical protein